MPGKRSVKKPVSAPALCEAGLVNLLVVEDDPSIAEPLIDGLRRQGFSVTWVTTGADALNAELGDVVLLDLGLPDLDGQVVCRRIRERSEVPLIVVTARSDELDRVTLLELGADDYVVKPFGFRELVARIHAVLRRARPGAVSGDLGPDVTTAGRIHIDRRTRRVEVDGQSRELTPKEYELLVFLAEDAGRVCERQEIIHAVWDENWWGPTKTLDVHIAALRRKLGDPSLIETVRGVGYRLADDT